MNRLWILLILLAQPVFGDSRVFIFRPNDAVSKQIGTINVSPTILIRYGLELSGKRSRFIALDSKSAKFNANLVTNEGNATGFLIVTTQQPVLEVYISSEFMEKVRTRVDQGAKQVMAREANLGVEFTRDKGTLRIQRVIVN